MVTSCPYPDGRNHESTSEAVNAYYSAALLEMQPAQTWWHVRQGDEDMYKAELVKENRLLPISEVLFPDTGFARELVNWTLPALGRPGFGEGWKGFVYTVQAVYDKEAALKNTRNLTGHDDGNSLTHLLWWIHSRGDGKDMLMDIMKGDTVRWSRHHH